MMTAGGTPACNAHMPKFTKSERLLRSSDFDAVYGSQKKVFSRNFFIVWKDGGVRRIGITVSAKVGKANVRNRIKRVVREFFRLNKDLFPDGDSVITARTGAASLANDEIRKEIENLLNRIR